MNDASNRRRMLSGASLILLGLIFVTNPLTHVLYRAMKESLRTVALRGFLAPLHMGLMVAGVIGITELLRAKADRTGLLGAALTVMGWAVGIRIMAIGQLEALHPETMGKIFEAAPLLWRSIVPFGLMFPIGLILLGATLAITRAVPPVIGVLLAIGGALFPMGRIPGIPWALVSCDLVLGSAFALVGWWILRQRVAYPATRQNAFVS